MLFKEGFGRWVVASVGCSVQSRFWHNSGQVSAAIGVSPLHARKNASPALGAHQHGSSKSKGTHPVSPRPCTHLREVTRTEEEPRGVPSCALRRASVPQDTSHLLQELPVGGKAPEGHSVRPSAPGSRRNFSLWEMSKCHPSPSPPTFWTQVFNEWRKTD